MPYCQLSPHSELLGIYHLFPVYQSNQSINPDAILPGWDDRGGAQCGDRLSDPARGWKLLSSAG